MIEFVAGDLLESRADMLVNAVNCVGVMGAGIALAFRQRWPVMFDDYRRVWRAGDLRPGRIHVWLAPDGTRIVDLPTKRHWRDASRYADIEAGLAALCGCIERFAPSSVAVPALGCGHGGLDWPRVASMIYAHLAETDARILVHGPDVSRQGAHTAGRRGREAAHRPGAAAPLAFHPWRCLPMIDTLFRRAAADAGWSDAAQIGVLLRYASHAGSAATLRNFLDRERQAPANEVDAFIDAVIVILRDPGLALDPSFRRYCAGCHDLLDPRQAAERWCRWHVA